MIKLKKIDSEQPFDWGKTSSDYALFRPGYPDSFYDTLSTLGVGRSGQRVLDLGTGTGVLAREFARRGAVVTGVDIADNQIAAAKELAEQSGLDITFEVSPAEQFSAAPQSFDVVSCGQSWLYFDREIMIPNVLNFLVPDGMFVLTHLSWLPFQDPIAAQSEKLVLKYNRKWNSGGYAGDIPPVFSWTQDHFDLKTFHVMHEPIPFTREGWCGRIRACRGVGAALSAEETAKFDAEHLQLLEKITPEQFTVLHQMSIHIFVRKGAIISTQNFENTQIV